MKEIIRRGDIYICDHSDDDDAGKQYVLVVQADELNSRASTVITADIQITASRRYLPTHVVLNQFPGLGIRSVVKLEQLHAKDRSELTVYIGSIEDEAIWKKINNAIKKTFGLWIYKSERSGDIRCLCPKCLRDYKQVNGMVIKRLDPFQSKKERCDKCDGLGYDYIIYDKKKANVRIR